MADMKDRQEGFERKFAFDEELKFKATARRNKLLGLWAAEKLGKTGADAETYAKEVIVADIRKPATRTCFARCGPISTPPACSSPTIRSAGRWTS